MSESNVPRVGMAFDLWVWLKDSAGEFVAPSTVVAGDVKWKIGSASQENATTSTDGNALKISISASKHAHHDILIEIVDQTSPKAFVDDGLYVRTVPKLTQRRDTTKQEILNEAGDTVLLEATHGKVGSVVTRNPFEVP